MSQPERKATDVVPERHPRRSRLKWAAMPLFRLAPLTLIAQLSSAVRAAAGSPPRCPLDTDTHIEAKFDVTKWLGRGLCIRRDDVNFQCYKNVNDIVPTLMGFRVGSYNGASGLLALLPTIGALLGAPTSEIWKLWSIVPFGGVFAMFLSFGGAILPIRVEDYDSPEGTGLHSGPHYQFRIRTRLPNDEQVAATEHLAGRLLEKLDSKLHREESVNAPKLDISLGLLAMVILLLGAQAAMTVVELGAILPWWCACAWWVHFWYILVTATAIYDNFAQLPFKNYSKIYLSDIPYHVSVAGGDDITKGLRNAGALDGTTISSQESTGDAIGRALKQLKTYRTGAVHLDGGMEHAAARNAILVIVSVVIDGKASRLTRALRLLSKLLSITVFVVGTAFFSSAQLLAPTMAVMVLTILLAAAVFSRAIASFIISAVERSEPMIHVLVHSQSEANQIIAKVMTMTRIAPTGQGRYKRAVQVEVDGHVFVDCKRVTHRSPWYVSVLGILASPFDLATLVRKSPAKRRASLSDMTVTAAQDSGISTGSSFALNQLAAPIQPVATQLPVAMHQPVAAHLPVVTQLPVATQLPASPVAPIQPGSSRSSVAPIQLASPVAPIQPGSPAAPFQPKQPGDIV